LVVVAHEPRAVPPAPPAPNSDELSIEVVESTALQANSEAENVEPSSAPAPRSASADDRPVSEARTSPAAGSEASVEDALEPEAPSAVAPPAPVEAESPRISLAQAGYTQPSLWALPDARPESPRQQSERRLERNLAESAMRLDYQRSVGIEGPLVAAINHHAYGLAPPRSKAVISVLVNGDGKVTAVDVLEVNDGMDRWRQVSSKVLAALRRKKLRVPPGQRVELVFEVESKVLLPSGRKPQRGVSVLGMPLGPTDDKHEPMVRILEPHAGIEKVPVPKPGSPDEEIEIPTLSLGIRILSVNPDPSDWLAHERQVVHTKLIRQRVL
jgi:hypothetical protein